jgi:hypothetical protein
MKGYVSKTEGLLESTYGSHAIFYFRSIIDEPIQDLATNLVEKSNSRIRGVSMTTKEEEETYNRRCVLGFIPWFQGIPFKNGW